MRRRRPAVRIWASVLALVLFAAPARARAQDAAQDEARDGPPPEEAATAPAEPGDPANAFAGLSFTSADEPIIVESDRLEFDYEKNRLVYRGSVHVVQGDLELTSKVLTVTFDRADELERAQLNRVVAQGDVVIVQGERRATGQRAVFDQATRQLILRGDPVLRDGPNEVQGDRITVYLDEERSVVESSPKKRVSAVLFPGETGGEDEGGAAATPLPAGSPQP